MKGRVKDITLFLLILLLIFSATVIADTIVLRYSYEEGEEVIYRHLFSLKSSVETGKLSVETVIDVVSEFTQQLQAVEGENYKFGILFNALEVNRFDRDMAVKGEENTATPLSFKEDLQEKLDGVIGQDLVRLTIDSKGKIVEEEIDPKVQEITQVNLASSGKLLVPDLPEEEVYVGYTWTGEQEFTLPQASVGEPLVANVNYEVVGYEEIGGIECVKIRASMRFQETVSFEDENEEKGFIEVLHIGSSYMYFSQEHNRLLRSITSQTMDVKVYLAADGKNPEIDSKLRTEMDNIITFVSVE